MAEQDEKDLLRAAHYELRDEAVDALRNDLVGPAGGPEEVIDDAPTTRYVAGMLFPVAAPEQLEAPDLADHDAADDGGEGTEPDPGVARLAARMPSSCGLTFAVHVPTASRLRLLPSAARYVPCDDDGTPREGVDPTDFDLLQGKWLHRAAVDTTITVDTATAGDQTFEIAEHLELFVRVREVDSRGIAAVTAVLVNTAPLRSGVRDLDTYMQVGLEVVSDDGAPCFAERRYGSAAVDDDEIASYDLLYRHARAYAVGHGCSAVWSVDDGDEHARSVRIEFVPEAPVNLADSNDEITSDALSMRFCAEAQRDELSVALRSLLRGYDAWIDGIEREGKQLDPRYADAVARHVSECLRTSTRLGAGIELLETDDDSLRAFRLANEAMRIQRVRTDWGRDGRPTPEPDDAGDGRWRPFQLAFILMCLPGIAEPSSDEREVVDLLWFPTGGGKTEAYLGLIAFTIFRRRIVRTDGAGVTVLMRYTLRLLTLQQFSRAALLIACCEYLRSQRSGLGDERISIGLWVGRGATPNTRSEAATALAEIKAGATPSDGDPRQLQQCVWCGSRLRTDHYWLAQKPPRLAVSCRNTAGNCHFASGLPVYLIDQDLYDYRPSLIIATVDKFASMPWNPDISALFGLALGTPPPELIVQDELHLISGPLGTLAGLYETAVDALCEEDSVRPKVIASTATIRRATQQVTALFDRSTHQFPPPGIDARDSYFAVEAPPAKRGNRLYVGVMAPATSQTTAMVRTYARLLASSETADVAAKVKDPYWTLLGYFNSLRVLGGARMQVQDDVDDRLKLLLGRDTERDLVPIEMTSRIASAQIPEHLGLMEKELGSGEDDVLDVVLATNMISVGVDVDRLGLMVVMGQPQATAEYIQATSRVGRQHPGLVVVVFNAARSRDRSHYESFQAYHGALYRQVESTSVTPFASRARDRGLHAVFIALCRMLVAGLRDNAAAADISANLPAVETLKRTILERVERVDPRQLEATREELEKLVDFWVARAGHVPKLRYSNRRNQHEALLADPAEAHDIGVLPTLSSLRDVDLESKLQLI
jgi:hypothetical protein